jgi:hypothetical protein
MWPCAHSGDRRGVRTVAVGSVMSSVSAMRQTSRKRLPSFLRRNSYSLLSAVSDFIASVHLFDAQHQSSIYMIANGRLIAYITVNNLLIADAVAHLIGKWWKHSGVSMRTKARFRKVRSTSNPHFDFATLAAPAFDPAHVARMLRRSRNSGPAFRRATARLVASLRQLGRQTGARSYPCYGRRRLFRRSATIGTGLA